MPLQIFEQNKKYGLKNSSGVEIMKPIYDEMQKIDIGLLGIIYRDEDDDDALPIFHLIDSAGDVLIDLAQAIKEQTNDDPLEIGYLQNSLFEFQVSNWDSLELTGVINSDGQVIVRPDFDGIEMLNNGVIMAFHGEHYEEYDDMGNRNYGYKLINRYGDFLFDESVKREYDEQDDGSLIFEVEKSNKKIRISKEGKFAGYYEPSPYTYTQQKIIEVYKPLAQEFYSNINYLDCKGIPEPHFPLCGVDYEIQTPKIAFVGMETNGWGDMEEFKNVCKNDIEFAVLKSFDSFENFEFATYDNNTGRDYGGFVFKFLKEFYNLHSWQELSDGTNTEILKTFAWANTHSIERFHVSAENNRADYEVWKQVQQASKIFDNVIHVLKALEPDILVITDWGPDGDSWAKDWGPVQDRVEKDHLIFLYLPKYKCHVVWTAHPRWLSQNTDFDRFIKEMVDELKDRLDPKSLWEI